MDSVNERTTLVLTISFKDEDDLPVVPSAAHYRIDDVASSTVIKAETALAPLASSIDLEILKGWNSMVAESRPYEIRRVTVEFDYGTGKHGTEEYLYKIVNLYGVTIEASASLSASISASISASASPS